MAESLGLGPLAKLASPGAVELARAVLEQDISDTAWADQIGPALSQGDVARLLQISEQAISKSAGLLRIRNRNGKPVYPMMQFDGRRTVPGIPDVLDILRESLTPLTIASWLTSPSPALSGARPLDALREGRLDSVLRAAHRLAGSAR